MIYLLSYFYESVYIYKPNTSREANSEKYIICKYFQKKINYENIMHKLIDSFQDLNEIKLNRIFNFELNTYFLSKVQEINAIYGQQQIENILSTINHIKEDSHNMNHNKEKFDKIKLNNIDKCIKWCKIHNQPIHSDFLYG